MNPKKLIWAALAMVVLSILSATAEAQVQTVGCGKVIDSPGEYQLSEDLNCLVGFPAIFFCDVAAITITAPNVHLDGQGFALTSPEIGDGVGIRITSTNVHVENIIVEAFNIGIDIKDGGGNHLNNVTLRNNSNEPCAGGTGLQITNANDNHLTTSSVSGNGNWGVRLISSHRNKINANEIVNNVFRPGFIAGNIDVSSSNENQINNNDLSEGGLFGVRLQDSNGNMILGNVVNETGDIQAGFATALLLSGSDNVIQGNLVDRQPAPFFQFRGIVLVDGARNIIRANTVRNQPAGGIVLIEGAVDNLIQANRSTNNTPWDAEDDNPNCDANVWRANRFGTANQNCIR